jgi:hypothetical protein
MFNESSVGSTNWSAWETREDNAGLGFSLIFLITCVLSNSTYTASNTSIIIREIGGNTFRGLVRILKF